MSCATVTVQVDTQTHVWAVEAARGSWTFYGLYDPSLPPPKADCPDLSVLKPFSDWQAACEAAEEEHSCLGAPGEIVCDPKAPDRTGAIAHAALHALSECTLGDPDADHKDPRVWGAAGVQGLLERFLDRWNAR